MMSSIIQEIGKRVHDKMIELHMVAAKCKQQDLDSGSYVDTSK